MGLPVSAGVGSSYGQRGENLTPARPELCRGARDTSRLHELSGGSSSNIFPVPSAI